MIRRLRALWAELIAIGDPFAVNFDDLDQPALQAVLNKHTPQGIYVAALHANGQPACGHDDTTDDDYDDHHEENDDGVMLCLDQRTGVACRGHHDDEGEQVPYPCDVVIETRAALGMPALNLEGAEPRG